MNHIPRLYDRPESHMYMRLQHDSSYIIVTCSSIKPCILQLAVKRMGHKSNIQKKHHNTKLDALQLVQLRANGS